ncbi:type II secretion system protein [Colwellia sp. RSH04]|uniref:type II secretion system protein n=1 Tax=Colwellia sp. RSH04 TaxID=2305464 RepID=UPI000E5695C5|nr:prepilin-type N-terminal cleavage/methylation domain-containing protein [Colwellia sp. RSH04]RHW74871.1 type II secretion system protein [Colwellia sp. RSH04]
MGIIQLSKKRSKGFTLVELLLAMVVFSSLVALATYSLMHFERFWHKDLGRFNQVKFTNQSLIQLSDVINSAYPQIVLNTRMNEVYYFLGREEGLTFVSYAPIFSPLAEPAVIRVFREKSEEGFRLVYEEAPLKAQPLIYLEQELNFVHRLVLANGIAALSFKYCGLPRRSIGLDIEQKNEPECFNEYDGALTYLNPHLVMISLAGETLVFQLSNADRLTENKELSI